ncbi:uncharacterized protein B0P05DRAFT_553400 [Gilbertella persicaria]|uniref:uncharacterized protein n=1 Tax=Gilbertella persicaria TaxID=101096 RepID=UPI00221EC89F|nr:uncharacterized protein B0P05DRAFT_553400 [Gilbertella persicaria]KAI8066208.1 hypothetical protein B0P05DRAFT_553400 [Gilbertella persicaria]
MTPEEAVLQLKKNGTFDELRKKLLSDFQSQFAGQKLLDDLKHFMEDMVNKDPSLLDKEPFLFHEQVMSELEKEGIFHQIHQDILETLKGDDYQQRVDKEIQSLDKQ